MARVLVVEDEPNMRKLISLHLRSDGHALISVGLVQGTQRAGEAGI